MRLVHGHIASMHGQSGLRPWVGLAIAHLLPDRSGRAFGGRLLRSLLLALGSTRTLCQGQCTASVCPAMSHPKLGLVARDPEISGRLASSSQSRRVLGLLPWRQGGGRGGPLEL